MKAIRKVDVKIGFQCNNHCRFCIQGDKRSKFSDKSSKEVKDILEKEKKNCNGVIFTGGEPTINKNLIDYVKYAKNLGYEIIQIQSNGRRFAYKDYCKNLISAGANIFNPAIHGSNKKIHDFLTCSPGSFDQTLSGIKNLKSLNQTVLINVVITKINYKDIPNIAKIAANLKPKSIQFAFMHINTIIQKDQKLINKIVPRYFEVDSYLKNGLGTILRNRIKARTEAVPYCFMERYEDCISEKEIPYTNTYDANQIIKDFNKIRKTKGKAKGPKCKECKYYDVCEGPWRDYSEIFGWNEFKPVKIS